MTQELYATCHAGKPLAIPRASHYTYLLRCGISLAGEKCMAAACKSGQISKPRKNQMGSKYADYLERNIEWTRKEAPT